jgi:hypothetical protein
VDTIRLFIVVVLLKFSCTRSARPVFLTDRVSYPMILFNEGEMMLIAFVMDALVFV